MAVKGGAAEDRDALSGPGDAQQCLTQRRCGKIDKFAQLKRRQIPSGIQQMDRRRIRLDVFQQQTELPVAQAIQRLIMQSAGHPHPQPRGIGGALWRGDG